jgi:hypothetical protein
MNGIWRCFLALYGGLALDFNEAERRFRIIEGRYRAGEIGWDDYQAQLYQLQVTDEAGGIWMLQASTGRWYVLRDGRWQAGSPPRKEAVSRPGSAPYPPAAPTAAAPRAAPPGRRPWFLIGGVSLALLACAGLVVAGVVLRPQLEAALPGLRDRLGALTPADEGDGAPVLGATEAPSDPTDPQDPVPGLEWVSQDPLPAPADGSAVTDEAGAALQVPPGTAPDDGQALLEVHEPRGELFDALEETYVFETGFYAATARGGDDGVGRATLRLPAAGPDSRVMAVIDGQHALMLDVEPADGVLTLNPRLGPSDPGGEQVVDGLGRGGSLRYAVVHPRQTARQGKGGPGHSAAPHPADDVERYCHVIYTYGSAQPHPVSGCRKNEAGTVFVSYPRELELADVANQVADVAEVMMARYRDHGGEGRGFPAATISRGSPLYITLVRGSGDPYYKPANGVIYLPVDLAKTITADGASSLYHEMAHWVQDA